MPPPPKLSNWIYESQWDKAQVVFDLSTIFPTVPETKALKWDILQLSSFFFLALGANLPLQLYI